MKLRLSKKSRKGSSRRKSSRKKNKKSKTKKIIAGAVGTAVTLAALKKLLDSKKKPKQNEFLKFIKEAMKNKPKEYEKLKGTQYYME